jgi:hypothetical protein
VRDSLGWRSTLAPGGGATLRCREVDGWPTMGGRRAASIGRRHRAPVRGGGAIGTGRRCDALAQGRGGRNGTLVRGPGGVCGAPALGG